MDLKFNVTVELKPSDVEAIIRNEMLKAVPGMTVKAIKFEAGQDYDRMDRPNGYSFRGAKVELEPTPEVKDAVLKRHDGRGPG